METEEAPTPPVSRRRRAFVASSHPQPEQPFGLLHVTILLFLHTDVVLSISALLSTYNPEWTACCGTAAGLIQDDRQVPCLIGTLVTGWVCHQYLALRSHTAQDDEVAGFCKMAFRHKRHYKLAVGKGIDNTLRL